MNFNLIETECFGTVEYSAEDRVAEKPTILLLHGSNGDGNSSFSKILEDLSSKFNVIIINYGGCGRSSITDTFSLECIASQVIAVITELNLKKISIVGISLGSVVAAYIAGQYPDLLDKLVIAAPWVNGEQMPVAFMFQSWYKLAKQSVFNGNVFGLSHVFSAEFIAKNKADYLFDLCKKESPSILKRIEICKSVQIEKSLKKIKAETLVIGLSYDSLISTLVVKEVHKFIKNSVYKEIPSGHAVQIEQPELLKRAIIDFIN